MGGAGISILGVWPVGSEDPLAQRIALVPEEPVAETGFVFGAFNLEPGVHRLGFLTFQDGSLSIINDREPSQTRLSVRRTAGPPSRGPLGHPR